MEEHKISVVVPLYNEEENVINLIDRIHSALQDFEFKWELLLVDDGSSDATVSKAKQAQQQYGNHVRIIELTRNFKQTAAMQAGIDFARGDVIVTMDGDLQNDPNDIPKLVRRLLNENLDLVAGWRKNRQDGLFLRKIPSKIANKLIAKLTGVKLRDYGCSLKAFRAKIIKKIRLYGEMHRFIPAWLATVTSPSKIAEEPTTHHARTAGVSKYGISRTFRVILDLLAVYFFMKFRDRPGHFFGSIGLFLSSIASIIFAWLLYVKIILGESIGQRPLLFLGILGLLAGLQFITTGVVAELLTRIYFDETRKAYNAEEESPTENSEEKWKSK